MDTHGKRYTVSFFLREPVLYQAPHIAKPVLTHIAVITRDYFIAGNSCTARMIPLGQAQRVLHFKLTLEDVEREVTGRDLDAGERIIWRRWLDGENGRRERKSRIRVHGYISSLASTM